MRNLIRGFQFSVLALGVVLLMSACGGGGGSGGGSASSGGSTSSGSGTGSVTLKSIAVTPASSSLMTQQTQQYTATATYSDGSTADVTNAVTWSSSNGYAASIDAAGLATVSYAGTGTTVITAATGGVSSSATETNVLRQTWMGGSSAVNATGVYGTLGAAAASNVPGARTSGVSWKDAGGNLWMFGGYGYDASGAVGYINDLWKWDGTNWTWMGGSSVANVAGVYGTKSVSAASNWPGGRTGGVSWTDNNGNFWTFGGVGAAASTLSGFGYLNDLWKWDGTNWTWIGGSNVVNVSGVYGTQGTAAASNVPGSRSQTVTWRDAGGNLWLFGGFGYDGAGTFGDLNDLWKWDGSNWTWMGGSNVVNATDVYGTQGVPSASNMPGARFDAVSWTDANGNFWLFGGATGFNQTTKLPYFYNDLWEYNVGTNQWTWVSGGSSAVNATGVYGTQGVPAAANVPGARSNAISWIDSSGNLWLFGGGGFDASGAFGSFNDLWKFSTATKQWTWVSGSNTVNQASVYGTLGVPALTNLLGARQGAGAAWTDASGNLWLFGGAGYDASGTNGYLNDLWKLSP